jgi:hypothetical protein
MNKGTITAVLVALIGVVGSVLPWFRFGTHTAVSGLDHDGTFTLAICIVVITIQLVTLTPVKIPLRLLRMGTLVGGAALLGIAWSAMMRLVTVREVCGPNMPDNERVISYTLRNGEGLITVLVASILLLLVNQWNSSTDAKEAV